MKFSAFKLNRKKEENGISIIDFDKYQKLGLTGQGLILEAKNKKQKIFFLKSFFYMAYTEQIEQEEKRLKRKLREWELISLYKTNKVRSYNFISDDDFDMLLEEAKRKNIYFEWCDDFFYDDEGNIIQIKEIKNNNSYDLLGLL